MDLGLDLDLDKGRPWLAIDLQIESNKSYFFIKQRKFSMYTETLLEIRNIFANTRGGGGRGSSAVERATPGEEVPGSIPAVAARSLQVGSVSV